MNIDQLAFDKANQRFIAVT